MADAPGLPEPYAHHVIWHGKDPADPGWQQYHDGSDPMPAKWDDDAPDEVIALYTADQLLAVRQQALEEAARICGKLSAGTLAAQCGRPEDLGNIMLRQVAHLGHDECAAAIRALAGKGET